MTPEEFGRHSVWSLRLAIRAFGDRERREMYRTAILVSYVRGLAGAKPAKGPNELMAEWGLAEKPSRREDMKGGGKRALVARMREKSDRDDEIRAELADQDWPGELGEWYD